MKRHVPLSLTLLVLIGQYGSTFALNHVTRVNRYSISHLSVRHNTTAHLIFNTVSSLLQHWPNTIYRNGQCLYFHQSRHYVVPTFESLGHTFVPATIPSGTLLHHGRHEHRPPPSPEYFAFDFEHSNMFSLSDPFVVFTYSTRRDLRVGYFDGTGASEHEGPRDLQDVLFYDRFIPPSEYNAWAHAKSMCIWAETFGLAGIVRFVYTED